MGDPFPAPGGGRRAHPEGRRDLRPGRARGDLQCMQKCEIILVGNFCHVMPHFGNIELVQGIVPTLTPELGRELGLSTASLNWISSVFLLSSVIWVPMLSKLGDLLGHRKMLRIAVVLLAIGSVLVAIAPNFVSLLIGRALQGVLLSLLPLEMALVRNRLSQEKARGGIAVLLGALTLGFSFGYIAGGLLLDLTESAQQALWVPAIATILCILVPFVFVPESVIETRPGMRMDWLGAALLTLGLGSVMLALALGPKRGWSDAIVLGLVIGGVVVLAVWWRVEMRRSQPLVAVRQLARPRVLVLYIGALLVGAASFGPLTAFATFAATSPESGYGLGLNGTMLGLFLSALGVGVFLASVVAPPMVRWRGQRAVVAAGFVVGMVAFLTMLELQSTALGMAAMIGVVGFSEGLVVATLPIMILERLPANEAGISAGLYNMVRTLGGSVMGAIIAVVFAKATAHGATWVSVVGYHTVWILCAAISLVGAALLVVSARIDASVSTELPTTDTTAPAVQHKPA
ncbi:MFS transporter [Rhodococcus sp. T2V]|uniref:MFS transporter n=1 Tax=Rhodococcus sp. T2V TaxID=3034164 RepID=UPI0023E0AA9F|nr:MFS transporter [Rhodococcus sp. T2V]MDF3312845.1 MFS transporter [Rhodococcus sp. T2V]